MQVLNTLSAVGQATVLGTLQTVSVTKTAMAEETAALMPQASVKTVREL